MNSLARQPGVSVADYSNFGGGSSSSESNDNYSMIISDQNDGQETSASSWDEWKAQRGVVYVNPDFVQNQILLEKVREQRQEVDEIEPPKSPSPSPERIVYKKGPRTPPEPVVVFLKEETETPLEEENQFIRISIDEEDEKEAGELDGDDSPNEDNKEEEQVSREQSKPSKVRSTEKEPDRKRIVHSPREQQKKRRNRSRSHEVKKRRSRSRSRKQNRKENKKPERNRSSSRDTFDGITVPPAQNENIRCNQCSRLFASAHDVSVHEIRSHETRIPCAICAKILLSPAKLVNHTEKNHADEKVRCRFCSEKFGEKAESLTNGDWNDFREHIFREILRRKIKDYSNRCADTVALRGVGRCPHGPAIKCRNFPKCPGARCIYSHGRCDFADTCSNGDCPFDHPNRPRVCMACVKDLKTRRRTRSPPSRSRE